MIGSFDVTLTVTVSPRVACEDPKRLFDDTQKCETGGVTSIDEPQGLLAEIVAI